MSKVTFLDKSTSQSIAICVRIETLIEHKFTNYYGFNLNAVA